MEKDIVFAGFGGQGVLTAGLILAHAANASGMQVLWMPAYGGQMRGGRSYSLVKFGDSPICHPDIEQLDVLAAMNLPSLEAFSGYIRRGGLLLINSNMVPDTYTIQRDDLNLLRAPLDDLACSVQHPKGANIVALGLLLQNTHLFSADTFEAQMLQYFEDKGKTAWAAINRAALKAGLEFQCPERPHL